MGLSLDPSQSYGTPQPDFASFHDGSAAAAAAFLPQQDLAFDPSQSFADQLKPDPSGAASFGQGFLNPQQAFPNEDFTIFPPAPTEQISTPLFGNQSQPEMATSQAHRSPTAPHLLGLEASYPGSGHPSPSFNAGQFVQPVGHHSRNASLTPEAALMHDWNGPHFQGHRRNGSEYSDASSIGGHSPSLVGQDNFSDSMNPNQSSPMLHPEEAGDVYQELHGINSFSISSTYGRSPSHSPAISPRILPQTVADANQASAAFILQAPNDAAMYASYLNTSAPAGEAFPQLPTSGADMGQQMPQLAAPTIEIDFAPTTGSKNMFDGKAVMDTDALIPPEQRGMFDRTTPVSR